jgi:CheY-like chemotaxis protein
MANPLAGKHILVVEDEYFIASDLKRMLGAQDAIIVGPVGDLETGMSLAETEPLDAAVLDVNLAGSFSYPVAERLRARSVPLMFLTGYDEWSVPEAYRAIPRLSKPYSTEAALDMLERLCARGRVS